MGEEEGQEDEDEELMDERRDEVMKDAHEMRVVYYY